MIRALPIMFFAICNTAICQTSVTQQILNHKETRNNSATFSLGSLVKINLLDAMTLALTNSPDKKKSSSLIEQRAALLRLGYTRYFPSITAEINQSKTGKIVDYDDILYKNHSLKTRGNNVALSFNWILYDSGLRNADIEYAKHMTSAANHDDDSLSRDIIINTIESFYKLQYSIKVATLLAETERIAYASAESIKRLFKAGVVPITDKLLAETAADETSIRKLKADSDMRLARLDFNVLVGLPNEVFVELEGRSNTFIDEKFTESTHALVERMVREHPNILSHQAKIQAAKAKITAARAENGATLSFVSSAYLGQTSQARSVPAKKSGWSVDVNLKIPLFDGFLANKKVKVAIAEKQSAQADLDKAQRDVEAKIYKNKALLDKETEHVRLLDRQLEKAQLTYKAVSGRYASGIGTVVELLKGQNDLANIQQQRIKAVADWHAAKVRLVAILGGITL